MRRNEAAVALAVGVGMFAAGMAWLFGSYGLIAVGLALTGLALLVDVKPEE